MNCPDKYLCLERENPGQGYMGFDNIGMAATNIFEMFTMNEWSVTMYTVRHATGSYNYDCLFIFTVMVGGYLVVNLVVGIQFNYFEKVRN
jgi:hypothetical protein